MGLRTGWKVRRSEVVIDSALREVTFPRSSMQDRISIPFNHIF